MRELEEEPADLIGKDEESDVDEETLTFRWKRDIQKYK